MKFQTLNIQPELIQLSELLERSGKSITVAESCTGGLIGAAITSRAGSSAIYDRGYITYSNAAKQDQLGVAGATLALYGAVSEQTATEMARGALHNSKADIALSVTGIAGPTGGSDEKPVGLVYIGFADKNGNNYAKKYNFDGNREEIREKTVKAAFLIAISELKR